MTLSRKQLWTVCGLVTIGFAAVLIAQAMGYAVLTSHWLILKEIVQ